MSTVADIRKLNSDLADKLIEEAKQNPQSPYVGKKVGIANGQVVIIADTWREVTSQLNLAEPDPARTFCIDTSVDYDTVEMIGR